MPISKRKLANGERITHKFLYIMDDYSFIGYMQELWAYLLKELFTYGKKYHSQNLIVDQGMSVEHGKFFLLIQVELTDGQFKVLTEQLKET